MLIRSSGELNHISAFKCYVFDGTQYFIKGFLYVPGLCAGEDSVSWLHNQVKNGAEIPFDNLCGAYTCCIKREHETLIFACNSEMQCLYLNEKAVSSSFIELLGYLKENKIKRTFSDESICEYITLGKVYFKKTFVKEIHMIPNQKYVLIHDGKIMVRDKGIEGIDGESHIGSPEKYFHQLAYALSDFHVGSTLTGGYDSRMVVTMLSDEVPMKLYVSANSTECVECKVSSKVADQLKIPLNVYSAKKPELTREYMVQLITETDGMKPLSLEGIYRSQCSHKKINREENCDLLLTGDGGVLHKDWEWMQDLPFYHKKATNLRRFYHQRIAMEENAANIGERIKEHFDGQEDRFVKKLEQYKRDINTRSYDYLYHYVTGSQCVGYNYDTDKFTSYAPLWELDLVRYSYHLPRRKRFFYNFIREMISNANPAVAKIPTNYGTTASNKVAYLFRDIFYQSFDYAKKAIRLLGRIVFHKTFFNERIIDWSLKEEARDNSVVAEAVEWAIEKKIIDGQCNIKSITYETLTRLLHLYLLKMEFEIVEE